MGDWNPLEDAELPAASAVEETVPVEGTSATVTLKDFNRTLADLNRRFEREALWKRTPSAGVDCSWHSPSCTLENWKHTDVKLQLGRGIAHITLSRPADNNVLSDGVVAALCDALVLLHSRSDIRVVVFSGEGKMLCAGRDPKGDRYGFSIKPNAKDPAKLEAEGKEALANGIFPDGKVQMGRLLQGKLWEVLAGLPQFTICVANGSALGDGMGFVACCDATIAIKTAFFGFSDTKLGLVNANITPHLMGKTSTATAKGMMLQGQILSAETAAEKGLVNRLVETAEDGRKAVEELCREVSLCGPRAVQISKELVNGVAGRQVDESVLFYSMAVASRAAASEEAVQARSGEHPWAATAVEPVR